MRKHYVDNLRFMCVLFLFPYHTFMVYNSFGESFYVKGADVAATTLCIISAWPWLMPLMFLLAGVSTAYSLKKRRAKEYLAERVLKLLVPLVSALLLLVPVQTYIAEVFHNGYTGGYFGQYLLFFTKYTDLTGYRGGFTPAHLWFLLYLFVICVITLPITSACSRVSKKTYPGRLPLPLLLLFFLIPLFGQMLLDINGKSLGEYLAYFLMGFFIISADEIQQKLQKYRFLLLGLAVPCLIVYTFFGAEIEKYNKYLFELLYGFYAWVTILAVIGLGSRCLNFTNRATAYLSKASFGVYIIHQQWIVITAFIAVTHIRNVPLQMAFILFTSVAATFFTYELLRRISVTRFMFGLKK